MRGLLQFALGACAAARLAGASVLAIVDERSTTSTFTHLWRSLEDHGHQVIVSTPQDAAVKLRQGGDLIEHLVVFAPAAKQLPAELSPQALARRLEAGTNLVLVASPDTPELWRDFAREFEVDFDDRGQQVVDHFAFDPVGDDGSHTLLSLPLNQAPHPFLSSATRAGPAVLYRGAGHVAGRHPLLTPVLRARSTAIVADSASTAPPADMRLTGSNIALVSAFQTHNNARAVFAGSVELFADDLMGRADAGNLAFARDLLSWVCQETGQLRVVGLQYREVGSSGAKPSYRTGARLELDVAVAATPAYTADDLQIEFGMLDPHLRLPLHRGSAPKHPADNVTTFAAAFTVPDRHGVFTLRIDHRRPGWTSLRADRVMSITPPRHDEYERFIAGALPYYGGAASVSVAFLVFVILWSLQS
ncbi:oligosaccharyl transferase glycoprotein complex, beta subunit [Rhodotorula kratochvilovae]